MVGQLHCGPLGRCAAQRPLPRLPQGHGWCRTGCRSTRRSAAPPKQAAAAAADARGRGRPGVAVRAGGCSGAGEKDAPRALRWVGNSLVKLQRITWLKLQRRLDLTALLLAKSNASARYIEASRWAAPSQLASTQCCDPNCRPSPKVLVWMTSFGHFHQEVRQRRWSDCLARRDRLRQLFPAYQLPFCLTGAEMATAFLQQQLGLGGRVQRSHDMLRQPHGGAAFFSRPAIKFV